MLAGIISDTHGLLRPEALDALRGAEIIIHAGDIGAPEVLAGLRQLAPVVAVRGNVDRGLWCEDLPQVEVVTLAGLSVYVLHELATLDLDPAAAGFAAVIYGHSHKPAQEVRNGVLYFNPGSAGRRRFHLPISVGQLRVEQGAIKPELIMLG